jgi:drug/metabolite transporter (DMT)-like permease
MKKQFIKIKGYLALVTVTIFWGSSFVSSKLVLETMPPMSLAFFRYLFAFATLFTFFMIFEKDKKLNKQDYKHLVLSSGIGIFIYFIGEYNALNYISASTASIIVSLLPVFMLVTNFFVFKDKITLFKVGVIVLTLIGVVMVVEADFRIMFNESLIGYSLMVMGVSAWVIYSLSTVKMRKNNSNIKVITYQSGFALLLFAPFAVSNLNILSQLDFNLWTNIIYLGVFASGLAFYLYVYSLKILGTLPVSIFGNTVPVVTVITGYIYLQETLTLIQLLGGSIIVMTLLSYAYFEAKSKQEKNND